MIRSSRRNRIDAIFVKTLNCVYFNNERNEFSKWYFSRDLKSLRFGFLFRNNFRKQSSDASYEITP